MSGPLGSSQWMYSSGEQFDIGQSVKFNDDDSQYLSWTPTSAGNRKTWTWSGWVKKLDVQAGNGFLFYAGNGSSIDTSLYWYGGTSAIGDMLQLEIYDGTNNYYIRSAAKLRDTSAWYHIVAVMDTTQATSSDRMKLYVNGDQITDFNAAIYPTQNYDAFVNSNSYTHYIGKRASTHANILLADVYFIDGQALDPTSFGETVDGYWKAKDASGLTFGSNGFHLNFKDDVVSEGFNAVSYHGTSATQSVSGLGFSPDFLWIKERTSTSGHVLVDSVRGATGSVMNSLLSQSAAVEDTSSAYVTTLDADGFTLPNNGSTNSSSDTYIAWAWDAGTGSAASNTDGSVTSSVKANTSYGFSIVTYTATGSGDITVGHGLGVTPSLIIGKTRNQAYDWRVFHTDLGGTKQLALNSTAAAATANAWGQTNPTSTVFTAGRGGDENLNYASGDTVVCYCFAEVSNYSSFGSYTGTGAAGNGVTGLGFEPAFLMIKRTDSTGAWAMFDNTRANGPGPGNNGGTSVIQYLQADKSNAEGTSSTVSMSFDSDGFTVGTSNTDSNASGGTYIYMAFADTREYAFWKDVSGNGNHWTPNALDYRDSMPDTPQNNFATFNAIDQYIGATTLSEGNLKGVTTSAGTGRQMSTIRPTSGKWYAEFYVADGTRFSVGIENGNRTYSTQGGNDTNSVIVFYSQNAYYNSTSYGSYLSANITTGDIVSVAMDVDNQLVFIGVNGVWQNSATQAEIEAATSTNSLGAHVSATASTLFQDDMAIFTEDNSGSGAMASIANFGQDSTFSGAKAPGSYTDANSIGSFQYEPPSGYKALCTSNLDTPTIVDGTEHFETLTYSGNSSTQSISSLDFSPDFVWLKRRSASSSHYLSDSVRGGHKILFSELTSAEYDGTSNDDGVESFDSNGFTLKNGTYVADYNASGSTYVAWNWKLGGTAVSNTDGTITSQVSAGEYMSICTYSGNGTNGATVGHGLGKVPKLLWIKCTSTADNWAVGKGVGSNQWLEYARLNDTAAFTDGGYGVQFFNDTAPTSSVFSLGTINDVNDSARDYVAYAFADLEGACKIGTYTGNGSSDGPMVFTGFKPSLIILKCSSSAEPWEIMDNKRETYNGSTGELRPSASNAETANNDIDFLSNGFKIRTSAGQWNLNGGTYIFLAIAETPFKFSPAR